MSREGGRLGRKTGVFVYAVILIGAAALFHSIWDLIRNPIDPKWLILALLTVSTGWIMMRIPSISDVSFSISDTFNIAAAVLFGPSAGAVTAALDGLVLSYQFASTFKTMYRVLFNMAVSAISIWLAAHVFFAVAGAGPLLAGSWGAARLVALLALFGAVNYLMNTGLVAIAVALARQLPVYTVWREHFLGLWITHFGGVLAAIPLLLFQRLRPTLGALDMLALVVPLPIILYTTFRHALGRVQDQIAHLGQVNKQYIAVIEALAQAIDAKDQVTHDHIRRVQTESVRLARTLGIHEEDELQAIMAASLLHDVGKLAIPEHILNKPGKLTPLEFGVMKGHAAAGAEILSVVGFPYPVVPIVRHHHESWDGTGYPDGLAGEDIPIGARILSVVDCFDALTSHRPYRPKLDDAAALEIIVNRRGTMYDPRVVDAFLRMHDAVAPDKPHQRASMPAPAPMTVPARASIDPPGPDRELLDLRAFYDIGRTLARCTSVRQFAEVLWSHLGSRTPASTFVLYGYDQASDALVPLHVAGVDTTDLCDSRIALGERLSGWVAGTRQTVLNSDARLDLDESSRDASLLRSALAVPVEADGRIAGVLSFYSEHPDAFDDGHRRLALAAADACVRSGLLTMQEQAR